MENQTALIILCSVFVGGALLKVRLIKIYDALSKDSDEFKAWKKENQNDL